MADPEIEEPPIRFSAERSLIPAQGQNPGLEATVDREEQPGQARGAHPKP
ncbi:hypothetical protein [Streptomyces sp. NPDC003393]